MRILQLKLLTLFSIIVALSIPVFGHAQQFDRQYLQWKAEQEAKDAKLAKSQPNHYLSKPTTSSKGSSSSSAQYAVGGKVRLNSAQVMELQQLHGVGEKKALAIIEYRQKNGGFKSIDDLKNVKGIGPKLLEKNKARLSL